MAVFESRIAVQHTPPAEKLTHGALSFHAPPGFRILQSIIEDFDADKIDEMVAWTVPEKAAGTAELWLIAAGGKLKKLESLPGFVPAAAGCPPQLHLELTGPRTVTYRVMGTCEEPLPGRVPSSALGVIAPLQEKPRLLLLRLAPPPKGVKVSLNTQSRDLDDDGHDDVHIRVTTKRGNTSTEASSDLVWLDRSAGLSRQLANTEKSFADIGSVEVVRSQGATTSQRVPGRLNNMRELFSFLCKESGTFAVTFSDGEALSCGDLSVARNFFARAEVGAYLTQAQTGEALGALRRADWFGGKISEKLRDDLAGRIREQMKSVSVIATTLGVRARASAGTPRFSPLSFDDRGSLLIQTLDGVWRYQGKELTDASDEVDPWPLVPSGPNGEQLLGLSFPCESSFIGIQGRQTDGRIAEQQSSTWPSPRPGYCNGSASFAAPELRIVRWGAQGLSAQLDISQVGPSTTAGSRGSPLSPDGATRIAQTELGLVVEAQGSLSLWKTDVSPSLSECVIANGATAAGCLRNADVVWLVPR